MITSAIRRVFKPTSQTSFLASPTNPGEALVWVNNFIHKDWVTELHENTQHPDPGQWVLDVYDSKGAWVSSIRPGMTLYAQPRQIVVHDFLGPATLRMDPEASLYLLKRSPEILAEPIRIRVCATSYALLTASAEAVWRAAGAVREGVEGEPPYNRPIPCFAEARSHLLMDGHAHYQKLYDGDIVIIDVTSEQTIDFAIKKEAF